MSRYLVDKFIYLVDRDPELLARYTEDPAGLVAEWEEGQGAALPSNPTERTSGHHFTAEERTALAERDFETLYAMGAHPFLLWTLMLPILEHRFPAFPDLLRHYNDAITPHGRPDFGT